MKKLEDYIMRLVNKKVSKNRMEHNINLVIYKKVQIVQIIKYKHQKKLIRLDNNIYKKEINIMKN